MTQEDYNLKKLKKAKEEILKIMKDNDIGGYVCLHRPGWTEVFWHYWTSYSILKGDFPRIRIYSTAADNQGNLDKKKYREESTCNMVHSLSIALANQAMALIELGNVLNQKFNPEHTKGQYIPDPPKDTGDTGLH